MTFKWYQLFHKAWMKNPPVDWLAAAYFGYKSPEAKREAAVANTRRMFDMLQGWDAAAQRTKVTKH